MVYVEIHKADLERTKTNTTYFLYSYFYRRYLRQKQNEDKNDFTKPSNQVFVPTAIKSQS
jgi:hypothetical protein